MLATCVAGVLAIGLAGQDTLHHQARRVMGSLADIQVYHPDAAVAERAIAAALDEMQRVDGLLSNYQPDTELSRMNASAGKAPFHASPELYAFVKQCRAFFDQTLGTFDPTIGPVVRAWGFFTQRPARPSPADAAAAKARSGFEKVRLNDAERTIAYAVDGIELDPGGIGKGYAADRAAAVLRGFGITSALVSAGGSTFYAIGKPPDRDGWKIAVRDPARPGASLRVVMLKDGALSTSGIGDRYVLIDGRRYGHIIDPRTQEPAEGMCQVTLTAPTATASDALTKAAFLLTRDDLVKVLGATKTVNVFRLEGVCGEGGATWTTPWSVGTFAEPTGER